MELFKVLKGGVLAMTWRGALTNGLWAGMIEWAFFYIKYGERSQFLKVSLLGSSFRLQISHLVMVEHC